MIVRKEHDYNYVSPLVLLRGDAEEKKAVLTLSQDSSKATKSLLRSYKDVNKHR